MKLAKRFLKLTLSLLPVASYAETGNIHLDQSQNIFFDGFSPSTFSLQVLQAKNQFNEGDIIFGGGAEWDLQHWQGDTIEQFPVGNTYQNGNGLYFTEATVDLMANINAWSTAFVSLSDNHIGRNDPDANYIYAPNAFFLFGDLQKAPVYLTAGINSIPFGVFAGSGPWDTPLTYYFSPPQAPQASLGFSKNGWNAAATQFDDQTNSETHYAYSFSYSKNWGNFSYGLGAGYLTDLQSNNSGDAPTQRKTIRTIPQGNIGDFGAIVDLNGNIRYREWSLNGEYDQGHQTVNGNDGKPKAYAISADYTKEIFGKDTTFGLSHSVTFNLKTIPFTLTGYDNLVSALPGLKDAWSANISRPVFKNTTLGLDFQRATTNPGTVSKTEAHTYTTTLDLMTYF